MFQKSELNSFRKDFGEAVKEIEKKYGVKLEIGTISYTDIDFHTKLTATKVGETGEKKVNVDNFNILKTWLGFDGNYGDTYKKDGITYKIIGLNSKRPKFAVELQGSDGKLYKTTIQSANMMLKFYGKSEK